MTPIATSSRTDYSKYLKKSIRITLDNMAVDPNDQLYVYLFTQMYTQGMADWDDRNSKSDIPMEEV